MAEEQENERDGALEPLGARGQGCDCEAIRAVIPWLPELVVGGL